RIAATAAAFTGLPAKAPSRSTRCSHEKPIPAKARACAAGSLLKTVARFMSPCSRRTASPFFRSIAGKRITGGSRLPAQEMGAQGTPGLRPLLGMKLRAGVIAARHHRRERPAIIGFRQQIAGVGGAQLVGV